MEELDLVTAIAVFGMHKLNTWKHAHSGAVVMLASAHKESVIIN